MGDWGASDLRDALRDVGVRQTDVVFCHAALAGFGRPHRRPYASEMAGATVRAFELRHVGTLCVPAFTYSACRGEVFDPNAPVDSMGMLSSWLWRNTRCSRSLDPIFSVLAWRSRTGRALTDDVGVDCFGGNSFWARLLAHDGIIVNLNLDAWCTFLHFCEKQVGVPYRKDRTFHGEMRRNGETVPVTAVYYSRDPEDPRTEPDRKAWDRLARESGVAKSARCGRGEVLGMRARDVYALATEKLREDPWFLVKGDG